ncbi:carboxypeptidase B [Culex quinquefasciatus]|uniref:carboxypeptidase B n=1 Tax=Culex quinquefasciatus TaxID=7176 RepID=UPI0018E3A976|nr:carboxypeptidase B [Culex quinquefasciatus]
MRRVFGAAVFVISAVGLVCGGEVSYRNYKLYDVAPTSMDQLSMFQEVQDDFELDFWSAPNLRKSTPVMVSPTADDSFRKFLQQYNITHQLSNENVQQIIDREQHGQREHLRSKRATADKWSFSFDHFWTLEEVYAYLDNLERTYPDMVRTKSYGQSTEGRPLRVITISKNSVVNSLRPVVLIDGGIHAREWGSPMAVLYLIHQLVENSTESEQLLEKTDWVIMPVANPDGYVYSHERDRMWRKNRARVNTLCQGVDLNRNFPFQWKYTSGECTNGYAGSTPGSEPETRALMLLMATYARATKLYLAVHTCGDYILYPYGYDYVQAPNAAELQSLGDLAADAVKTAGGPDYSVGGASFLLYPANGSDDFIYGSFGIKYAYTLELSCGTDGDGFVLSVPEMQNVTRDAFEMFKVFGKFAGEQPVKPRRP